MKKILIGGILLFKTLTSSPNDSKELKLEVIEEPKEIVSHAFDDDFFTKQIQVESSGLHKVNGRLIRSKAGALGIAQFMPSTWRWLKKAGMIPRDWDIHNKKHQMEAQKIYMNYLYQFNYGIDYDKHVLAIAAYNAGPGRVKRLAKRYGNNWIYHLPEETKNYLIKLKS